LPRLASTIVLPARKNRVAASHVYDRVWHRVCFKADAYTNLRGPPINMITRIAHSLFPYAGVALLAVTLGCGLAFAGTDEIKDFEADLKEYFPGSYVLYTSLSGDSQQRVYKEYRRSSTEPGIGRFSKVIAKILELVIEEGASSPMKMEAAKHS
jgi:hypothetical protein